MLVNVIEGTLKGEKLKNTLTSEDFYSFKGIPFAKPPLGHLRFKNPVPPEKYEGVWDATQERSRCSQKDSVEKSISGDEDCLYLNVYMSQLPEEGRALKPVMFYVHGGGFNEGQKDSFLHGPDFLVAKDVVLVIPNYRLHIFGFLNLGIEECPGNVGLKDLVFALKWIKQNVRRFGGDPDNITIFGESAGAAAVSFLLFSPLSRGKGLFHKAIVQSCDILDWPLQTMESSTARASRVAIKLGFESKNPHELYNFLSKVPAQDLTHHVFEMLTPEEKEIEGNSPFFPSLEVFGPSDEKMVPAKGVELMKLDPGVPVMQGICSQEAIILLLGSFLSNLPAKHFMDGVTPAIRSRLFRNLSVKEEKKQKVIDEFKQFYFSGKSKDEEIIVATIDLLSDLIFIRGIQESIETLTRNSSQPVYPYLFSYRGNLGIIGHFFNYNKPDFLKGAGHADDLGYLFSMQLTKNKTNLEKTDRIMIQHMTTIWTNFAKYGDPGKGLPVDFRPNTSTNKSYLDINKELIVKPGRVFEDRMKFIEDIRLSLKAESSCYIGDKK